MKYLKHIIITLIAALSITSNLACTEEVEKPVPKQEVEELRSVEEPHTKPQEKPAPKEAESKETEQKPGQTAKVTNIIDGDTIEVSINGFTYKIRYIGIDTPETKHPSKPVQYYGKEAYEYNKKLVDGKKVRLVKDVSETDRYERLLRYVYVGDLFVNAELVKQGYARVSTYPPDVKYADYFLKLEREARKNNRGLWGKEESSNNQTEGSFVGNKNSKKLHNLAHSQCRKYESAMSETNKVFFKSQDEGIKAGYIPCKVCYP